MTLSEQLKELEDRIGWLLEGALEGASRDALQARRREVLAAIERTDGETIDALTVAYVEASVCLFEAVAAVERARTDPGETSEAIAMIGQALELVEAARARCGRSGQDGGRAPARALG